MMLKDGGLLFPKCNDEANEGLALDGARFIFLVCAPG